MKKKKANSDVLEICVGHQKIELITRETDGNVVRLEKRIYNRGSRYFRHPLHTVLSKANAVTLPGWILNLDL